LKQVLICHGNLKGARGEQLRVLSFMIRTEAATYGGSIMHECASPRSWST